MKPDHNPFAGTSHKGKPLKNGGQIPATAGATCISQPGGSTRDQELIAAALVKYSLTAIISVAI